MSDAANNERSRLMQKHRDELAPLIKDVKKKKVSSPFSLPFSFATATHAPTLFFFSFLSKGLLKDAAQKKVDEVAARHEIELTQLREAQAAAANNGNDAAPSTAAKPKAAAENGSSAQKKVKKWPVLNWTSQARSELDQACTDRGLSKKGKKEDLVVRLTLFSQEQQHGFESGDLIAASDSESDGEDSGSFEIVTKVVAAPHSDAAAAGGAPGAKRGGGAAGGAHSRGGASAGRGGGRGGGAAGAAAAGAGIVKKNGGGKKDDDGDSDEDVDDKVAAAPAVSRAKKPAAKKDDDDDDAVDSDDMTDDDEEEDPYANETPEQKVERERLEKRRTAVIGCIYRILKADEEDNEGIHMDALTEKLAANGVKNFRPELVGYTTIEEFLEEEQGKYFKFGSNTKLIKLIRERDESAQAKRKPNGRQKHNGSAQRGGPRFQ
jgi:hypothetical protein